jgi:NAD(P)-dependent dehydrogenase (short-subunit alcohol dehydrogenase family)
MTYYLLAMDLRLQDRAVLVTGGGAGIGLAIVEAFAGEGSRVLAVDRDIARLEPLDSVHAIEADLLDPDIPARLAEEARQRFGGLDVLVNNLAIAPIRTSFLDVTDADWRQTLDANLLVMARCCRAVLPDMVERGSGALVSLASDVARQPNPGMVDYSVSKAAVLSLSKLLSIEFGPHGIRSNVISPGPTRTPGLLTAFENDFAPAWGMETDEAVEHFVTNVQRVPTGRIGEPEDVAACALFLASDLAGQVTGSDYRVDGGTVRTS